MSFAEHQEPCKHRINYAAKMPDLSLHTLYFDLRILFAKNRACLVITLDTLPAKLTHPLTILDLYKRKRNGNQGGCIFLEVTTPCNQYYNVFGFWVSLELLIYPGGLQHGGSRANYCSDSSPFC